MSNHVWIVARLFESILFSVQKNDCIMIHIVTIYHNPKWLLD